MGTVGKFFRWAVTLDNISIAITFLDVMMVLQLCGRMSSFLVSTCSSI